MTLYLNDVTKNTESESASRKLYLHHYQYMYTVCGVIMLMLRIVYSEKSSIFFIILIQEHLYSIKNST